MGGGRLIDTPSAPAILARIVASQSRILSLLDTGIRALLRRTRRSAPRGVLLVRSGGLGDTVLFSHALPLFLRYARSGEPIAFLTPEASLKTTFLLPKSVQVIGVDYRRFLRNLPYRYRVSRDLYGRNFRAVVSTDHLRHPLIDEAMIAACMAEETLGMAARPWAKHDHALRANRRLFTRLFESGPERGFIYERWIALAGWLTGERHPAPVPRIPESDLPAPAPAARPFILLQPFSAKRQKQPPPELFQRIIENLPPELDAIVTGHPSDISDNPAYASLLRHPNVRFDGRGFEDLVPLLRAARLVVSVDTALMHLAVAVGAETVCLASAAYVGEIVPYPGAFTPANAHFLHHPIACEGCRADCRLPEEEGMYPCVARLDGSAVLSTIARLLAEKAPPRRESGDRATGATA